MRGGDLHLHVDGGRAHVERAAEDVGEAEHVVDLVRIVGASGRHDGVVAHLGDFLGVISGSGLAMAKMIGFAAIDFTMSWVTAPLTERPKNTSAPSSASRQRARLGLDRVRRLPLVHALGAALIDHALGVAEDQVLGREADRLEQFEAGDAGGAGAVADELGRP